MATCLLELIESFEAIGLSRSEAIVEATILKKEMDSPSGIYSVIEQYCDCLIEEYTVESSSMDDCVPKMIRHEAHAHPEKPHKQIVAIAFSKCREKHGSSKPKKK